MEIGLPLGGRLSWFYEDHSKSRHAHCRKIYLLYQIYTDSHQRRRLCLKWKRMKSLKFFLHFTENSKDNIIFNYFYGAPRNKVERHQNIPLMDERVSRRGVSSLELHGQSPVERREIRFNRFFRKSFDKKVSQNIHLRFCCWTGKSKKRWFRSINWSST